MKLNVENIKVLKVNDNGEIVVFKTEDIVELEYSSITITGRLANIDDESLIIDCSEKYSSNIHEVTIDKITWIKKIEETIVKNTDLSKLQLEEFEEEKVVLGNEKAEENMENEPLILNGNDLLEDIIASNAEEKDEEEEESVSLFGSIKRNYAQGISPILNR